jgi:hypothetical protein
MFAGKPGENRMLGKPWHRSRNKRKWLVGCRLGSTVVTVSAGV